MTNTKTTTLRAVLKHKIPIEGDFGIDESEVAALLGDPDILRVELFQKEGDDDAAPWYDVECFQARLGHEPEWTSIVKYQQFPSGSKTRNEERRVQSRIENLYESA